MATAVSLCEALSRRRKCACCTAKPESSQPPPDTKFLADTIRILNDDPQLRRNFANRAFQRARECFNAHRMTDNYVQLYHSVMAKKAAAA